MIADKLQKKLVEEYERVGDPDLIPGRSHAHAGSAGSTDNADSTDSTVSASS